MTTSHTPAPWTRESEPYDDGMPYSYIFSGNQRTPANFKRHELYISGIMKEADADLIAAAPDLLEALKLARKLIKQSGMLFDADSRHIIDTAVCKAEGYI